MTTHIYHTDVLISEEGTGLCWVMQGIPLCTVYLVTTTCILDTKNSPHVLFQTCVPTLLAGTIKTKKSAKILVGLPEELKLKYSKLNQLYLK